MRLKFHLKEEYRRHKMKIALTSFSILVGLVAWTGPARAQSEDCVSGNVVFEPTGTEPLVGHITVTNESCFEPSLRNEWTEQTEIGGFRLVYDHTWNSHCSPEPCPDTLTVWGVPEGYSVRPDSIVIPEKGTMQIEVFDYLGF